MESINIQTHDGLTIKGNLYFPADSSTEEALAGIIINSATAVSQGYYQAFAEHLAEHGYLVITYDYRGIGASTVAKQDSEKLSMRAWGEQDFSAVIDYAVNRYPDLSWHCIGHSVGGQLVGLAANNSKLTSVYCVAAQNGYWKHWGLPQTPKILLMWYGLIPMFSKTVGYVPGFMLGGTPLPGNIALEWARWCKNPNFISDEQGQPLRKFFHQFDKKMRFLVIKDDLDFAPLKAVKALKHFYRQADHELEVIDPKDFGIKEIGHFGFFKRQHKDKLWPNAIEWFGQFS
ncbi:alpha/beta hydrolase family protein [Litoribrevibacter albus]|uniref:Alpha/beta hydrolase n=1 Tax=Litoribrevibacter albus TaxID=1473156 RepID=A0AA37S7G6_9GAMM|nr:alpha/beta fold hydrolase [Litoribrevibacter albus]GLQ29603.1 alpha/beta hydrolase [Litoribrevibacter albus]